jgi:hypothetical protein
MLSTRYSWRILIKREFPRGIFEKDSNIKFHQNPFSGSGVVPRAQRHRRTNGHTEAGSLFLRFCECVWKVQNTVLKYQFCKCAWKVQNTVLKYQLTVKWDKWDWLKGADNNLKTIPLEFWNFSGKITETSLNLKWTESFWYNHVTLQRLLRHTLRVSSILATYSNFRPIFNHQTHYLYHLSLTQMFLSPYGDYAH